MIQTEKKNPKRNQKNKTQKIKNKKRNTQVHVYSLCGTNSNKKCKS